MDKKMLETHAKEVGVDISGCASESDAQSAILGAIRSMDDAVWDALSDEIKVWSNELFEQEKASPPPLSKKKPTIPSAVSKAKSGAKAKSEATKKDVPGCKLFKSGSNSDDIYQIVHKAGVKGITIEDAIKAAEEKPIKSKNVAARVKDILNMCSKVKGLSCSGLMRIGDGKYYATDQSAGTDKPETASKPEAKKPIGEKLDTKKPIGEKLDTKKPAGKKPGTKKSDTKKPAGKKPDAKKPAGQKPPAKKPAK